MAQGYQHMAARIPLAALQPALHRLDGIAHQVYEHPGQLRFRTVDKGVFQAHVGEFDVVPAVEQADFLFQQFVQVELHRVLGVQFGEGRELAGRLGEDVDLREHLFGNIVEPVFPHRIPVGLQADELLDLELDGRERVLDFVGHLPCHRRPGLVAFRLGQLAGGIVEIVHH